MTTLRARIFPAAVAAVLLSIGPAAADSWTWVATTDGTWNTPGNWTTASASPVPVSDPATALTFSGTSATYTATNDIGAGTFTLNSILVTNTGTTTIAAAAAANSVTFAGATPSLTVAAGAGSVTVSNNLIYGDGTTV